MADSMIDSNSRSIAIFGSYFALCLGLLSLILSRLNFRNFSKVSGSYVFTSLAVASLGSTWYYMVSFFMKSYGDWQASQVFMPSDDGELQLGEWLSDVKLFQDAWGAVVESPQRWWWSQQIFLATAAWSVFLAAEGSRRGIKNLWSFMLIGQVVSVSFASNLFFLTILLNEPSPSAPVEAPKLDPSTVKAKRLPNWLYFTVTVPLGLSYLCAYMTPKTFDSSAFLPFLLVPHVLLLAIPIVFERLASSGELAIHIPANRWKSFWKPQYRLCSLISVACHANAISQVTAHGMTVKDVVVGTLSALYEHPAVSSVGWDVIMMAVSVGTWVGVRGIDFSINPDAKRKGGDWINATAAWIYMALGSAGLSAVAFAGELEE
ncbi:uncharacterized protein LAJ45_07700 [Morchella importuna]|uniref:uncharacterized protein n=1 Tax=Morchella importuna TaxID=1174673 RepID=UPI001E8ED49C|nr:uncharacterized protein LAJ45_07700 [Morchella importuna]KAH8148248.1 hypothetical protein LAJ45_07700 [Morchella importuna]